MEISLNDIRNFTNVDGNVKQGTETAVALATVQDQINQKKQKVEAEKVDLTQQKFNGSMNTLKAYGNMSPEMQKKFKSNALNQATGFGLDTAETIFDAMDSDPAIKSGIASLAGDAEFLKASGLTLDSINSQIAANPLGAVDAMQLFLKQRADFHANKSKTDGQFQRDLAIAGVRASATKDAASIRSSAMAGNRAEALNSKEFMKIAGNQTIKKRLDNFDSLSKGSGLFDEYANDPKGIPITVFRDISNDISSGLRLGGGGGVGEREKTEIENFNTRIAGLVQKWDPAGGVSYVSDPALIASAKKILNTVKKDFKENVMAQAKSLYRKSDRQSINDAQSQAISQLKDRLDGNTNTYDAASGNTPQAEVPNKEAPAAAAVPATNAAKVPDASTVKSMHPDWDDAKVQRYLARFGG